MVNIGKNIRKWLECGRPFSLQEAEKDGFSRSAAAELCRQGLLIRAERGIYLPAAAAVTENISLQITALKAPHSVICLLSALRFHNFTTQQPAEMWLAIRQHSHIPVLNHLQTHLVMLSEKSFEYGIEEHDVDGVKIRVYSAAKTAADCFKFRNQLGIDTALEALREGFRQKLFTIPELMAAAKVCRVAGIITPYAESLFS